jgi:hypothetical protein
MRRVFACALVFSALAALADEPSRGRAQNPDREPPNGSAHAPASTRGRSASAADDRWLPLYEQFRKRERGLALGGLDIAPPVTITTAVEGDLVTLTIVDAAGASFVLEIGSGNRDQRRIPLEALSLRDARGGSHAITFAEDGPALIALLQTWRDEHANDQRMRRVRLTETPTAGASTMQLADWVTQLANAHMTE